MTKSWWNSNVSNKALKSNVSDALGEWEKNCTIHPEKFVSEKQFNDANRTCEYLLAELGKAHKKCGLLQGETKKVIESMATTAKKYQKQANDTKKRKDSELEKLDDIDAILKHKTVGHSLFAFAKKQNAHENIVAYRCFKGYTVGGTKDMVSFIEKFIVKDNLNIRARGKVLKIYNEAISEDNAKKLKEIDWKSVCNDLIKNIDGLVGDFMLHCEDTKYSLIK